MAYIGVSPSNGVRQKHTYTATASQTTFSGAGAEGVSLSYRDSNYVDVYRNGVKLGDADYTATSGTSIVLGEGAAVSDIIEIIVYDVFSVADTVSKADGGVFDGNVTMAGNLSVDGNLDVTGSLDMSDANLTNVGSVQLDSISGDADTNTSITFSGSDVITVATGGSTAFTVDASQDVNLSGSLTFADNEKAIFGAGSDLQIFSNGTSSYITESGSGNLEIRATDLFIKSADNTKALATFDADGASSFSHNGITKLATTATGIDVTGVITTDGMTTSADINFGNNDKALFGTGDELQIYSDGTTSIIRESGSGGFLIDGANIQIRDAGGAFANFANFASNGAATIYYDGSPKLATTSTGIDVTGTATMDGLTVDGVASLNADITQTAVSPSFYMMDSNTTDLNDRFVNAGGTIFLQTVNNAKSTFKSRFSINNSTGDFSLYEDTGTTAKLFWNASTERLGIGAATPERALHIADTTTTTGQLLIQGSSNDAYMLINKSGATYSLGIDASDSNKFKIAYNSALDTNTRLTIDGSGNVGIGTSSPSAKLDVAGGLTVSGDVTLGNGATLNIDDQDSILFGTYSGGTSGTLLQGGTSTDYSVRVAGKLRQNISTGGDISFYEDTGTTPKMVWKASEERLGIGTNSPSDNIEISQSNNNGATLGIQVHNTNTGTVGNYAGIYATAVNGLIGMRANAVQTTFKSARVELGSTTAHPVSFVTSNTERMLIDSSGNVGIGNASAVGKLEVYQNNNSGIPAIYARQDGTAPIQSWHVAAGTERMRITSAGDVGIGTQSPAQKLHIDSATNTRLRISTTNTGAVPEIQLYNAVKEWKIGVETSTDGGGGAYSNAGASNFVIRNQTDTTTAMAIDTAGHVTMPYQSAFLAQPSSIQTNIAIDQFVTVLFGTERFDQNADYNTATSTFTAPVTGKYHFETQMRVENMDTGATYYNFEIYTTNRGYQNIIKPEFSADVGYWSAVITALADMDAGDTAYVRVRQQGGTQQTDFETPSHFSGYLVC